MSRLLLGWASFGPPCPGAPVPGHGQTLRFYYRDLKGFSVVASTHCLVTRSRCILLTVSSFFRFLFRLNKNSKLLGICINFPDSSHFNFICSPISHQSKYPTYSLILTRSVMFKSIYNFNYIHQELRVPMICPHFEQHYHQKFKLILAQGNSARCSMFCSVLPCEY